MDTPTNTVFAIQIRPEETYATAIHDVFSASMRIRKFFRRLEVVDTFEIGSVRFVRCRVDRPDMTPILLEVFAAGRGIIMAGGKFYVARIGNRKGSVNMMVMHRPVNGESIQRMYKGSKIKGWETQFGGKHG